MRNDELIDKVVDHLREHPSEWEQRIWASECGTKACFAGHAMLLSGYTTTAMCAECSYLVAPDCVEQGHLRRTVFVKPSGEMVKSGHEAKESDMLLGLSMHEGASIYYGSGGEDLEILERRIALIREGKVS